MFNIAERPEFTHEVKIAVPADKGYREESMRVRFRAIPDEEADAFRLDDPDGMKAFLREIIVHIDDLVGGDGKPIAWSEDVRELVLGMPWVRMALMRAYTVAVVNARLGN